MLLGPTSKTGHRALNLVLEHLGMPLGIWKRRHGVPSSHKGLTFG